MGRGELPPGPDCWWELRHGTDGSCARLHARLGARARAAATPAAEVVKKRVVALMAAVMVRDVLAREGQPAAATPAAEVVKKRVVALMAAVMVRDVLAREGQPVRAVMAGWVQLLSGREVVVEARGERVAASMAEAMLRG